MKQIPITERFRGALAQLQTETRKGFAGCSQGGAEDATKSRVQWPLRELPSPTSRLGWGAVGHDGPVVPHLLIVTARAVVKSYPLSLPALFLSVHGAGECPWSVEGSKCACPVTAMLGSFWSASLVAPLQLNPWEHSVHGTRAGLSWGGG